MEETRSKALEYILKILDKKWNPLKDLSELGWKAIDWSLRFEAHSYIANKYEERKDEYALELRDIWKEWVELCKEDNVGKKKIFWPHQFEMIDNIDQDGNADVFPGNEIESHISMFRAKEVLGLTGYENYFKEAKKILADIILEKHPYSWRRDYKIIWQIVRSPKLRNELTDFIRIIFHEIKDADKFLSLFSDEDKYDTWNTDYQAMAVFFLSFCALGMESIELAKRASVLLIDKQEKNGSFGSGLLSTCLASSSIYSLGLDPSKSICTKALEYILSKQNKKGNWDFLYSWDYLPGDSIEWNVLSTVVVLETIDLISNDKPLPIWAEKTRLAPTKERISRIKSVPVLNVPEGITWTDISINFISKDDVEIRAGKPLGVKNFIILGFKDERTSNPDLSWNALRTFAKGQGEISWKDQGYDQKVHDSLKSCVKVIRKRFKQLFNINDDPFEPYYRTKSYKTKFHIFHRNDSLD